MDSQEKLEIGAGLKKLPQNERVASRCIFCKQSSITSVSVEHIIPESLGNSEHILPKGVVCDKCNNYFAVKIEGPLLETPHFKHLRARQSIINKRGRVPPLGVLLEASCEISRYFSAEEGHSIAAYSKENEEAFIGYLQKNKSGTFIIPACFPAIDKRLLSRFLAKVGVEMLAHRVHLFEGWEMQVTGHAGLDLIRNYARYGIGPKIWPFYEREIYDENQIFGDNEQTLHEFDLLYTDHRELYAVICIFGTEYTINMGGPELEGYEQWLKENSHISHLYGDKNKDVQGGLPVKKKTE